MRDEDKKRYLKIANFIYDGLMLYEIDPYSKKTHFVICDMNTGTRKQIENVASAIQYVYDNNYAVYSVQPWHSVKLNEHTLDIHVIPDLETTIKQSVFDILKEFSDKKAPEFVQQLDNAILNGHITFKEYNKLYKLTKVNGG